MLPAAPIPVLSAPLPVSIPATSVAKPPPPPPNTNLSLLHLCTHLQEATQVHALMVKTSQTADPYSAGRLAEFYALSDRGSLEHAEKILDSFPHHPPTFVCNTLMRAYSKRRNPLLSIDLYRRMLVAAVEEDRFTFTFTLKACTQLRALAIGMQIHAQCGLNRVTLISVLSAVTQLGALGQGQWVHAYIKRHGIELDENLSSALINMYSKCGCIEGAIYTFEMTHLKSVDTWNAMIGCFTANGCSLRAIDLFSKMEASGLVPNKITFTCVLNACSHGGLVDRGIRYFEKMTSVYDIEPDVGHYGCMVDLFSRAGLFEKAEEIIQQMPIEPDKVMWKAIVGACRVNKNYELGEKAGLKLIELAPDDNAGYVLLSNIYAMSNNWNGVYRVRKLMHERGIKKVPGCSSIELDGLIHEFIAGDAAHARKKEIYEMLDEMAQQLKRAGYEPDTTQVLLDIEEEDVKESSLALHSEKLAVAYGLIRTSPGSTIRVVKNLRICGDCHSALKLLSQIYDRNIIVRDANRFHHFSKGSCSCMDYW
ncbi:hypothetical protein B296_00033288 [Ensete ventricosum]|uniref:DYW domain-containing protein n=1 Tax=Ensete ventricosum TaxID=4639 RepID=A0A427A0K9_ENSVE|nr:hypothetical protein B296_00033288 [Ensete ventricosum]